MSEPDNENSKLTGTHLVDTDVFPKRLVLRKSNKRPYSGSPDSVFEGAEKRSAMDDDVSGDELDFLDVDEKYSSLKVVSNFSQQPSSNGCRTLHTGALSSKKLVIKNFKKKERTGESLHDSAWNTLKDSVFAIQSKRTIAASLEQLYKLVETLCENKLGSEIYDKLQQIIRQHVVSSREQLIAKNELNGVDFLVRVDNLWTDYCQQMTMIRSVFLYLDRTYILQNSTTMSIWESALLIFREEVMDSAAIRKRLVSEILKVISEERGGALVDRNLLRSLLRMLSSLQIYNQVFEVEFLDSTTTLYSAEGERHAKEMEALDYLQLVQQRLHGEEARSDFYLDEATRKPLFDIVEKYLISNHVSLILTKGLDGLLDDNNLDVLKTIFDLFGRVKDGHISLKTGFSNYIKRTGKALVMNPEKDKTMVEDVMAFKDTMDHIVEQCFANQEKFQQAERDAFDYFINTRQNKPAELVAKFMDAKLRSANKEASDEELDQIMDKVIVLFRFIQGKDVFEAFYKKDLAKRLLLGRSASVDAEKAMLSKLKQECGSGFTHKLEGMFKDMEVSKDLALAFRQHNEHEADRGQPHVEMDFMVNVLTLGQWPPYEPVEVNLPCRMGTCLQMYKEFYISKHSGRKLQWQHSLGTCVLKAVIRPGCVKELMVSLYQAIVLLMFNDSTEYTLADLASATNIERKELIRTLVSLACGKVRILLKSPKGKEIVDTDTFTVNTNLQERLCRIKISQVQMKETEEEHQQTEEQVNQDRQYQIDAAVVRIMKTRKTLAHQQLIAELFAQLRFPVKSSDLKKRIGSLIERDYLSRDTEDTNLYKYVT